MTNHNIPLLIPAENQVCELYAKILLACITARRRLQAIIGLKRDVESRIAAFLGRAARGMSREYAEGLRDHKQAVFEDFQRIDP